MICIHRWKRPRTRRRRLHVYSTDPRRSQGDLRTTNRQDSTDAPALVASSISRIKKINFFDPQFLSYCSLWTTNEPNAPRTTAWSVSHANLVCNCSSRRSSKLLLRLRLFQALGLRRNTARDTPSTLPQRCAADCPTKPTSQCAASVTTRRAPTAQIEIRIIQQRQ